MRSRRSSRTTRRRPATSRRRRSNSTRRLVSTQSYRASARINLDDMMHPATKEMLNEEMEDMTLDKLEQTLQQKEYFENIEEIQQALDNANTREEFLEIMKVLDRGQASLRTLRADTNEQQHVVHDLRETRSDLLRTAMGNFLAGLPNQHLMDRARGLVPEIEAQQARLQQLQLRPNQQFQLDNSLIGEQGFPQNNIMERIEQMNITTRPASGIELSEKERQERVTYLHNLNNYISRQNN